MSWIMNPYRYAVAATPLSGCSGDVISTLNLGAYWKFDDDYTDDSGNGHTLTANNSPVFTGAGYYDEAVVLTDATNDYLSSASSTDYYSSGNTWSMSAWIYVYSFAGSADPHLLNKRTSSNGFRIVPRNNDTLITCGGNYTIGSGWDTGSWEHIAVTLDGTTIEVWRNGSSEGTATISGTWDIGTTLYIGTNQLGGLGTGEWDGRIDDLSIWRRKLTDAEIGDLYTSSCPLKSDSGPVVCSGDNISLLNLVGYYKFETDQDFDDHNSIISAFTYTANTFTSADTKIDYAIEFTNADANYIYVGGDDSLYFNASVSGTSSYFAWVKINSFDNEASPHLFSRRNDATDGHRLAIRATNLLFSSYDGNQTRATNINTGQWYHIGFTFDNGTVKLYQNGSQVGADCAASNNFNINNAPFEEAPFYISANSLDVYDGNGDMEVDEFYIYHRILTAEEIATLASSSCPLTTDL